MTGKTGGYVRRAGQSRMLPGAQIIFESGGSTAKITAENGQAGWGKGAGAGCVLITNNPVTTGFAVSTNHVDSFPLWHDARAYESAEQTITAGAEITLAHGLGARPRWAFCSMRCLTAQLGFAVGDEVDLASVMTFGNAANNHSNGVLVTRDASNVYLTVGIDETPLVYNRATGQRANVTAANWRLVARAFL